MTEPLIVCCSPGFSKGWEKLGPRLTSSEVRWVFLDDEPVYFWEKIVSRPNLAMIRACLQAVLKASRSDARLLITHDPRVAFLCAIYCRILGIRVDHYVDSFNFSELPTGMSFRLMRYAFRQIRQLTVHSRMERGLYSRYFDIPEDKIRLRLWSIDVPKAAPAQPLVEGRYVSALGGNGRDYGTLIEASRMLPEIPFVLVVRPENLTGLTIPDNVQVMVDIPSGHAMNIMLHSAFTVLPLAGSTVPCGHVTLVCAMHLRRAVVATESTGISDYVFSGHNSVLCEPASAKMLAAAIEQLWSNPAEAARLAENNQRFGAEHCSDATIRTDLAEVLTAWDIPLRQEAVAANV